MRRTLISLALAAGTLVAFSAPGYTQRATGGTPSIHSGTTIPNDHGTVGQGKGKGGTPGHGASQYAPGHTGAPPPGHGGVNPGHMMLKQKQNNTTHR